MYNVYLENPLQMKFSPFDRLQFETGGRPQVDVPLLEEQLKHGYFCT